MEPNNDRPPLTSISTNGTYKLKLIKPKFEKVKQYEDGTTSSRLFFVDHLGNCISKSYGTKYAKSLAMLIGKITGTFTKEIRLDATPAEYIEYVTPACGIPTAISVEVTPNGEWEGRPQFKYKLTFPYGLQSPIVAWTASTLGATPSPSQPPNEALPF